MNKLGSEFSLKAESENDRKHFDLSTVFGILFAFVLIAAAIFWGGKPLAYLDLPSTMIVLGGTIAVTAACYSFEEMFRAYRSVFSLVSFKNDNASDEALKMIELADIAKKTGFLSLQNHIAGEDLNPFLEKGLQMVIDDIPVENIEKILTQEVLSKAERHKKSISILRKSAEIAPAMGLIGTLIGLVQMLGNLDDPSTIGPAMAVALLTTLYGAVLAFMFFTPVATKLERNSKEEILLNQIYFKGIMGIARKENPRNLEALLNTVLPPHKRIQYYG